jgi:DNA-binding CsgD family transcriptional regulator
VMRLSHTELERFHAAILELHQYRDLDEFLTEGPAILSRVAPLARFSLVPQGPDEAALGDGPVQRDAADQRTWLVCADLPDSPDGAGEESVERERQRAIVELLRPHLELACSNARLVSAHRSAAKAAGLGDFGLTRRESDVAQWVASGKTNAEIARILGSSARTVEKHVERVLEKLGVENRTAAALLISSGRRR